MEDFHFAVSGVQPAYLDERLAPGESNQVILRRRVFS